jgi:hypothetical protein
MLTSPVYASLIYYRYPSVFGLKLKGQLGILSDRERNVHYGVIALTVMLVCLGTYASGVALYRANWAFTPFSCKST